MPEKLFVAVIVFSLISGALGIASWRRDSLRAMARASTALAFVLALAAWLVRWKTAGHLPLFGTWESALSLAVFILAIAMFMRTAALGVAPFVAAIILAHGALYDSTAYALTISERSLVVDVHSILAWAAFALLTANAGIAIAVMLQRRRAEQENAEPTAGERSLGRTLSIGFLLYTSMIATGALYKFMLFGVAWSFDPIETLALASWLAYGTLLHLHLMGNWNGVKLARWCAGVFILLVLSYRAIVFFPPVSTYHIFDINLRIHVAEAVSR